VRATTADLAKVALTDLEAVSTAPVPVASTSPVVAALVIWTAKLKTGGVADNRANASRTFNAADLIVLAAEDLAATVLVEAAASEAGDDN
jgi:hypothetical protein